jgi:hypothetical protein
MTGNETAGSLVEAPTGFVPQFPVRDTSGAGRLQEQEAKFWYLCT